MSKKADLDARKALEILQDAALSLRDVADKLGVSTAAVDEARCLADEIPTAESDAILAMPPVLGRALLWAACNANRHDVLAEACGAGDKEIQREARRIAHNLKLKGVSVALPAKPAEAPRPAPATEAAAEPPVYLSSLDTFGERAVFWTRNLPGRGVELAQLVVSDDRGIIDLLIGEMSRKRFREMVEELPRRGAVTIREVSRADARTVLDRARVAAREGGEAPAHFPAWAAQVLGPAPTEAPAPLAPRAEGRPLEDPAVLGELLADSASLLEEPELARWAPDEEAIRSCAAAVEAVATSPLYLAGPMGDAQREEAILAAIDRAADAWFSPRRRASFAARLLDTGLLFEQTDRAHGAKVASATARVLAAGTPAAQIPFARELFTRLFRRARAAAPPAPSASSVLVANEPNEPEAPTAGPGERVTAGGLIVPE